MNNYRSITAPLSPHSLWSKTYIACHASEGWQLFLCVMPAKAGSLSLCHASEGWHP